MQIEKRIITKRPETEFDRSLEQALLKYLGKLSQVINKGIRLEDNFNAAIVDIADSGAANSENTVAHNLGRTPIGFIVINIDKAGVVYDSGTAWDATNIYLKCDVANCAIKVVVL